MRPEAKQREEVMRWVDMVLLLEDKHLAAAGMGPIQTEKGRERERWKTSA